MLEVNLLAVEEERQAFEGDRRVPGAVRRLRVARRLKGADQLTSGLAVVGVVLHGQAKETTDPVFQAVVGVAD